MERTFHCLEIKIQCGPGSWEYETFLNGKLEGDNGFLIVYDAEEYKDREICFNLDKIESFTIIKHLKDINQE